MSLMRKINKVILGVAAGSMALVSQSHGYSSKSLAASATNYQDSANVVAQNNIQPNSKPTPTYASKPTPTYASKPTPTYASKPTPTYASKPSPKPSPKPTPKISPKVSPKISPKVSPKSTDGSQSGNNFFSGISKFFSGLFGR
jgi:outer membrane biosynthesis protein TonB